MNFVSPHAFKRKSFWTPARFALSLTAFALVSSLTTTSCSRSTNETNSNATNTNSPAAVSLNDGSATEKPVANSGGGSATPARAGARDPMPPAIRDAELQMADGKPVKLSDYAGKVVVLNFWATWCGPCRQETPHLVELSNEYKKRDVEFVGLSVEDPESSAQAVKAFASAQKIPYKVGWAAQDFQRQFLLQGGAQGGIPQSFVIMRDGRLLKHFVGVYPSLPAEMRQAIEQALDDDGNA